MRKIMTPLTILILSTGLAGAGELTLRQAVDTALHHNPAIQAAEQQARAAAARARQAKGYRLPSLDLMEMYDRTDNPAEVFAFELNQERFDMMSFFASDPNDPEPLTTWLSRLELVQPVYTGGKLGARIHQADSMARAAELEARRAVQKAAFDTATAYINLAKAREYLDLLKKARKTTASHVRLAEQYAKEGMLLNAEVLKAKVYLAKMDELVEQAENGADLAEAALNFQMGIDQGEHHELAPLPKPPAVSGSLDRWIRAALDRRRDLNAARRKRDAGRLEEKVARSGYLPQVAVVGRYDLYDDTFFGNHGDSSAIMAVAKINLFHGGSDKAAVAAARHQSRSFDSNIHRFEEGVRLEVRQAFHDLETARARLATARSVLDAAREELRVREQRFKQGLEKMIDLLDAETALREAEVRELTARYDVALSTWRLELASGANLTEIVKTTTEATP